MILLAVWQFGATMVIFLAGLKQIPKELYEAAEMDGAGPYHRFRAVTIPLLSPVIFFNLLLGLIGAFQVFSSAYIISNGTGGPAGMTNFITLYLYKRGFSRRADGLRRRDRVGAAGRRRDHRLHPLPHPAILGALLRRQPMSTTSFGEQAIATLENQVDATPQSPAPQGQAQDLADRHLVRRADRHHRGRALPAGLAVPVDVQAERRVRHEHGPAARTTPPSRTTPRSPRASPGCRCGSSS